MVLLYSCNVNVGAKTTDNYPLLLQLVADASHSTTFTYKLCLLMHFIHTGTASLAHKTSAPTAGFPLSTSMNNASEGKWGFSDVGSLAWNSPCTTVMNCCITSSFKHHTHSCPRLIVPRTRLSTTGDQSFHVIVTGARNSLPTNVTASTSLLSFKKQLKTLLFTKSFALV